ncbi:hypothetical protein BDZ89DRAFT_1117572 [Hymenopellis radicata]|nr:hypothetical protein BDZ89DRAFT_1117572 [Hymenopellis radicata]
MTGQSTAQSDSQSARRPKRQVASPSISVKVKQENSTTKLSSESPPPPGFGWQHPAELDYIDASSWPQEDVIRELVTHAISIPGRPASRMEQWCTITDADGNTTVIPAAYRIPLLFAAQFQWSSLQLVLGVEDPMLRAKEWAQFKSSIMHISRVCQAFLAAARKAMEEGWGMSSRKWRCATLDRVLTRYRMRWMLSTPEQLKEFYDIHGEFPYERDVLKCHWKGIAVQGYNGFKVSDARITEGVSVEQFMDGLRKIDGDWIWNTAKPGIPAATFLDEWRKTEEWRVEGDVVAMEPSPLPAATAATSPPQNPSVPQVIYIPPAPSPPALNDASPPPPSPSPVPTTRPHTPAVTDSLSARLYQNDPPTSRKRRRPPGQVTGAEPPPKAARPGPLTSTSPYTPGLVTASPRAPPLSRTSTLPSPMAIYNPPPPPTQQQLELQQTVNTLLELINTCNPAVSLDRRLNSLEEDLAMLRRELDGDGDEEGLVIQGTGMLRPVGDGCSTPVKFSRKGSQSNLNTVQ